MGLALVALGDDSIAGLERVEDGQRFGTQLAGDGVAPVEMRLRGVAEEELAAARFRAVGGDAERAAHEVPRGMLVGDGPAGTAVAVAAGIAALRDEVRDHAMKV